MILFPIGNRVVAPLRWFLRLEEGLKGIKRAIEKYSLFLDKILRKQKVVLFQNWFELAEECCLEMK
jgi:hypothetical protein